MPLHSCKNYTKAKQSNSESIEWSQYKPQEHGSMKFKERMDVNKIKKGNAFNNWMTVPK